jgi:hypothetical protein
VQEVFSMLFPNRKASPQYKPENLHRGSGSPEIIWSSIARVYPPQDLVISSMLESCGIPFKLQRREVSQMPVSIGPLAEVEIFVPSAMADEARSLIENYAEDTEKE